MSDTAEQEFRIMRRLPGAGWVVWHEQISAVRCGQLMAAYRNTREFEGSCDYISQYRTVVKHATEWEDVTIGPVGQP